MTRGRNNNSECKFYWTFSISVCPTDRTQCPDTTQNSKCVSSYPFSSMRGTLLFLLLNAKQDLTRIPYEPEIKRSDDLNQLFQKSNRNQLDLSHFNFYTYTNVTVAATITFVLATAK